MKIVPSTPNGLLIRAIGSTDVRGAGTFHPIADVNPFVFLEHLAAPIEKAGVPNFGLHPHSGVTTLTIGLSGTIESVNIVVDTDGNGSGSDNFNGNGNGNERRSIHGNVNGPAGPFLLATHSGRGVVHDDHTHTTDPCDLIQCAWLTGDNTSEAHVSSVADPVILRQDDDTEVMLCAGKFRGKDSGIPICPPNDNSEDSTHDGGVIVYVTLPPGGVFQTSGEDIFGSNAFVYNMNRDKDVRMRTVPTEGDMLVVEDQSGMLMVNEEMYIGPLQLLTIVTTDHAKQIKIENRGIDKVSALVGYGKPIMPPWSKLLMSNGFIYAPTEEEASRVEEEFRQVGMSGFGQRRPASYEK